MLSDDYGLRKYHRSHLGILEKRTESYRQFSLQQYQEVGKTPFAFHYSVHQIVLFSCLSLVDLS